MMMSWTHNIFSCISYDDPMMMMMIFVKGVCLADILLMLKKLYARHYSLTHKIYNNYVVNSLFGYDDVA